MDDLRGPLPASAQPQGRPTHEAGAVAAAYGAEVHHRLPLIRFLALFLGGAALALAASVALLPALGQMAAFYVWAVYAVLFLSAYVLARQGVDRWATGVLLAASFAAPWTLLFLHPQQPLFGIYLLLSIVITALLLRPTVLLTLLIANAIGFSIVLWQVPGEADVDVVRVGAMMVIGLMLWGATRRGLRDHIELARALGHSRAVLENTTDAIIALDLNGRVVAHNEAARERAHDVFGLPRGRIAVGSPLTLTALGARAEDLVPLRGGRPAVMERRYEDGAGNDRHYIIRINPIPDLKGSTLGYVVQGQDITERILHEAREREHFAQALEMQKLREVNAYKSNLLNAASHELATPLTPLLLQVHVLRETFPDGPTPAQARSLEILERNILRLHALIDSILEVTRIENRHIQLKRVAVHVDDVVRDEVASFRTAAAEKGVRLRVAPLPDVTIVADPRRFAQILSNLLANAIKFTPAQGTVEVSCHERPGWARFEVHDTGLGIPPERLKELFQPFVQLHEEEGYVQGPGLGLYISQGIVLAHGGRIGAESGGEGEGSTFWFELPLLAGTHGQGRPTSTPVPPPPRERQVPPPPSATGVPLPPQGQGSVGRDR